MFELGSFWTFVSLLFNVDWLGWPASELFQLVADIAEGLLVADDFQGVLLPLVKEVAGFVVKLLALRTNITAEVTDFELVTGDVAPAADPTVATRVVLFFADRRVIGVTKIGATIGSSHSVSMSTSSAGRLRAR